VPLHHRPSILIAPDSFKGCLSAGEVADAIEAGVLRGCPSAAVRKVPLADGGEGTVDALVAATAGRFVEATVTGPLGEPVSARYGLLGDGATAVIEMAAASGLPLVPAEQRKPLVTTTYGTGQLIRDALDRGCREVIIGVGGSATVDGGAGMAQALGFRLLDASGREIERGGGALKTLARIDAPTSVVPPEGECRFLVACDVLNPLLGEKGAARVYGPQKGATPEMVEQLEAGLAHLARVIRRDLGTDVTDLGGGGAAGGLGAGLVAFLRARIRPGVEVVIEACGLESKLTDANLVITAEGQIDAQTAFGKTAAGVAALAGKAGVPVIALAGAVTPDAAVLHEHGIAAMFSIADGPMTLQQAMQPGTARDLLSRAAEQLVRALVALGCIEPSPAASA
jgi:glycerate kinase